MATKRPAQQSPAERQRLERERREDSAAYSRLRQRGHQLPHIAGAAALEALLEAGEPWPSLPESAHHFDDLRGHVRWLEQPAPDGNLAYFSWERDQWRITGYVTIVNGCFVISSLSLSPNTTAYVDGVPVRRSSNFVPAGGVVTATLRLPIEKLRSYVQQALLAAPERLREWEKYQGRSYAPEVIEEAENVATAVHASGHVIGRPKRDDDVEETALLYLRLLEEGVSKGIVPRMAKELFVSEDTIRARIKKATRHGYLSPGIRGHAGRLPGIKLIHKEG
jgi:hypothetical protein